jgi:virginiamycin B lyase
MRNTKRLLWAASMMFLCLPLAAADVAIKGVVTDGAGKPVRGATVKATQGTKAISRFSQGDGRYEIAVAPGTYQVSVEAYGFAVKNEAVDTTKGSAVDFQLKPAPLALERLSGAELEALLPNEPGAKMLEARCNECHSFPTVIHRRGSSADEWESFLPNMVRGTSNEPFGNVSPQTLTEISAALGKYFGPDSPYFSPDSAPVDLDKIKHVDLSDDALRATIVEYTLPTRNSRPHSITVDQKTNIAWFGEESFLGNKITKFDINEEKFTEYPLQTEKARPHTGGIAPDGVYWQALAHDHDPAKLASVDPETGKLTQYNWPEEAKTPAHTLTIDHKGNIWFSGSPSGEIWTFDVPSKQFKMFKYTAPTMVPNATTYDAVEDHNGIIWFSQVAIGSLLRFDPATGDTKEIVPPETVSIRGIAVDNSDNLWFGDYHGHRFGKMNVKTMAFKFYKAPTVNFSPYGVSFNKVDGNVWFADLNGNNITRFNPKTEKFTEFRIPAKPDRSYARFIGADAKGRVWFTEWFGDKIGYVDPTGGKAMGQMASAK